MANKLTLRNGLEVIIRQARPEDAPAIGAMHERLSPNSIYQRYLIPSVPGPAQIEQFTRPRVGKNAAFVVKLVDDPYRIIAIAEYVSGPAGTEPAILVEDAYQGQGLGRKLFNYLLASARLQGVRQMMVLVEGNNRGILHLLRTSGYPMRSRYAPGTREIELDLISTETPMTPVGGRATAQPSAGWPR